MWPHQDNPQDLSSGPDFKNNSRFNNDVKTLMNFNASDAASKVHGWSKHDILQGTSNFSFNRKFSLSKLLWTLKSLYE